MRAENVPYQLFSFGWFLSVALAADAFTPFACFQPLRSRSHHDNPLWEESKTSQNLQWQQDQSCLRISPKDGYTTEEKQHEKNRGSAPRTRFLWLLQEVETLRAQGHLVPNDLIDLLRDGRPTNGPRKWGRGQQRRSRGYPRNDPQKDELSRRLYRCFQETLGGDPCVQERIATTAALMGLVEPAVNMTEHLLVHRQYLPRKQTQELLATALRKEGACVELELLMLKLGQRAILQNSTISNKAFNIILASFLDQVHPKKRFIRPSSTPSEILEKGFRWSVLGQAREDFGIVPDEISYATMLQASSIVGNRTLSDAIWGHMVESNAPKTVTSYNARLKILTKTGPIRPERALKLWKDFLADPNVQPDRYSIDIMLLNWARSDRLKDAEVFLDQFVSRNSEVIVSNAFVSFLNTLCKGGELRTAIHLFDEYLRPALTPVLQGSSFGARLVRPNVKHFNVVLQGFRSKLTKQPERGSSESSNETFSLYSEAMDVFRLLDRAATVQPDKFTMTTMIGICLTSNQIMEMLKCCQRHGLERRIPFSVIRAAVTRYGELGDASSACILLARSCSERLREWNVLLYALKTASVFSVTEKVEFSSCQVSTLYEAEPLHPNMSILLEELDGLSYPDAARMVLSYMANNSSSPSRVAAPRPDSQSYCMVASALQQAKNKDADAMDLFREACSLDVQADGPFINAIIRCFGDDVRGAIQAWKDEIREACVAHEKWLQARSLHPNRKAGKNYLAAYHGLLYCCGRALRPDLAVRLVYAIRKEGLEASEVALRSYYAGKQEALPQKKQTLLSKTKWSLLAPYESILYVECSSYNVNDKRRIGERRVRIIV